MSQNLVCLDLPSGRHIAVLTLNRLAAGNALNTPMLDEILRILEKVELNTSVRAMIMCSAGKHASLGADLNELIVPKDGGYANMERQVAQKHVAHGRKVVERLFRLRVPIIGIVHGYCLGGGAELYTFCDVLYGASGGKEEGGLIYGFPEPAIGVMAGWMGPEMLIKKIGVGYACDLLFSGRKIAGDEALKMGIVRALYPKDELLKHAMEWADQIAANAPLAVESTRRTVNRVLFPNFDDVLGSTGQETIDNLLTADFVKGATKILNKSDVLPYARE